MIELKNISKTYSTRDGEHQALDNVSLHVARGEVCGIIGESGAGKSTLVRCINLLERPTSGSVVINGTDVTDYHGNKLRNLRANIGMIFQNFSLFQQRTVLDNVTFPLLIDGGGKVSFTDVSPKGSNATLTSSGSTAESHTQTEKNKRYTKSQARERAMELLDIVGLADKAGQYPSTLSGGQQQRVAIARALANNPSIMLCDEATSALDTRTTVSVLNLLKKINEEMGVTLVVITHSLSVARYVCSHVAVLDAGRIVEEGNTREVFDNPRSTAARELVAFENFEGQTAEISASGGASLQSAASGGALAETTNSAPSASVPEQTAPEQLASSVPTPEQHTSAQPAPAENSAVKGA